MTETAGRNDRGKGCGRLNFYKNQTVCGVEHTVFFGEKIRTAAKIPLEKGVKIGVFGKIFLQKQKKKKKY